MKITESVESRTSNKGWFEDPNNVEHFLDSVLPNDKSYNDEPYIIHRAQLASYPQEYIDTVSEVAARTYQMMIDQFGDIPLDEMAVQIKPSQRKSFPRTAILDMAREQLPEEGTALVRVYEKGTLDPEDEEIAAAMQVGGELRYLDARGGSYVGNPDLIVQIARLLYDADSPASFEEGFMRLIEPQDTSVGVEIRFFGPKDLPDSYDSLDLALVLLHDASVVKAVE